MDFSDNDELIDSPNFEKDVNAYKTIGEVAILLNLPQHVLRFWETQFKQINPVKIKGRRYYKNPDINILKQIKTLLYDKGFTIKGAQSYFKDFKNDALITLNPIQPSNPSERITNLDELIKIRDALKETLNKIAN
ncbi:MAG: MerR family transcriptional regulator [Sphingobacteriia bacterium]|nr:MerR family transcriptional regulator [Sphingobacteriia bacterium]